MDLRALQDPGLWHYCLSIMLKFLTFELDELLASDRTAIFPDMQRTLPIVTRQVAGTMGQSLR